MIRIRNYPLPQVASVDSGRERNERDLYNAIAGARQAADVHLERIAEEDSGTNETDEEV